MLDQFRAQKLEWNRANNQIYDRVETSSGDSNGRTLFVQISNGGTVEDLTGAALSLAWNKKTEQGLESFEEVDAKKGQYRLFYPTGMLVNHGVLQASLVLVDVTGRIESKPFDIIVHKGAVDDEAVESDNKFTALTMALVKVSQVQAEFDGLYADKSLMMDTLHDDKKADMEALEQDYANRANTLETTYAPRLTSAESEIDMARGGAQTLGERLDADKSEVSEQLAQKANQNYVDTKIASVVSGSPKGSYPTVSDLQTAFPTGNTNIYVVNADGNWYYWDGAWKSGGVYQATNVADESITLEKVAYGQLEIAKSNSNLIKNSLSPVSVNFLNATTSVVGQGVEEVLPDYDFQKYSVEKVIRFTFNGNGNSFHLLGNNPTYPTYFDMNALGINGGEIITVGGLGKIYETDGNTTFSLRVNQLGASFNNLASDLLNFTSATKINKLKKVLTLHADAKHLLITVYTGFPYTTQQAKVDVSALFISKGDRSEQIFTHVDDNQKRIPKVYGGENIKVSTTVEGDYVVSTLGGESVGGGSNVGGSVYSNIYGLGDSIMAGFFTSLNAQFTWWTSQKIGKLINNVGIFGNHSSDLLARMDADVIAHSPSHCILSVGTNDINSGVPSSTLKANVIQITQKLLDANIVPIWIAVPPRNDYPTLLPTIRKHNYFLYNLCVERNIPFIDTYNLLANANGTANLLYFHSDQLHLNAEGAYRVGMEVEKAFKRLENNFEKVYFNGDSGEIIANSNLVDSNADGVADSWTTSGNFGVNLNRRIEIIGGFNYQVLEKINNINCYVDFKQNLTVEVGKAYRLESNIIYENSNPSESNAGLVAYIVFIDSSGNAIGTYEYVIRATIIGKIDDLRIFKTFTVPQNTVTTQLIFRVSETADKTLKVGRINCFEI